MDGYIRVSQVAGREGERFHSPDEQREAIEGWARLHGVKLGIIHTDLDRSGKTMSRPGMDEAMRRVRDGQSGGIIVARIDRFARTVPGGLATIEELHGLGARVVSVAESLDPATPMGEAMLGLLLIMARWQWRQADDYLAAAQQRAAGAGRFPGRVPYGYVKTEDGLTTVDDTTARIVLGIFSARASGVGWRKIADDLGKDGVPTPLGRDRWAPSTVWGIIRSEAPLGVFCGPRGLRVEDAWPAIIDRDLWERANDVRGTRDNSRQHHDLLFAGIARCAWCRLRLSRTRNPEGYVSYACTTRGCDEKGSIGGVLLDQHVAELVDERLARIALEPAAADDGGEADRLRAGRDAAVRELEAWRDDVGLRDVLGAHDWREGLLARARARDDAEVALVEMRARGGLRGIDDLPAGVVPTLAGLPWEVQRRVVEALLHSVWLRPTAVRGRNAKRHVGDRLRVVWRDEPDRPVLPSGHGPVNGPVRW